MAIAIRYFSKFGHSAQMANIVSQVTGGVPETVAVPLSEPVDTIYLDSGVMLGKISGDMVKFIKTLSPDMVRRVVCFGSCAIIKSPVPRMCQLLEAQGVSVDERSFTCRGSMGPLHAGHPNEQDFENLRQFIMNVK